LLLHKVEYYNPKGKSVLKTSSKYYAGDLGLLSTKIGFNSNTNTGFRMENTVLLQLLNFGYEVYTYKSKLGKEIDFVAIKNNKTFYIQVTAELNDENYKREVGNLLSIRDG
jgi:predicted AAA+ superfamily ATPase